MRIARLLLLQAVFIRDVRGATAIEYGLIACLIGVALVGAFTTLGTSLMDLFTNGVDSPAQLIQQATDNLAAN